MLLRSLESRAGSVRRETRTNIVKFSQPDPRKRATRRLIGFADAIGPELICPVQIAGPLGRGIRTYDTYDDKVSARVGGCRWDTPQTRVAVSRSIRSRFVSP